MKQAAKQKRAEDQYQSVLSSVMSLAASMIGSGVEADQPLMEAGLDSLGAPSLVFAACCQS